MTKLEQKLLELGYRYHDTIKPNSIVFKKVFSNLENIFITIDFEKTKVIEFYVTSRFRPNTQPVTNQLQKDLKELKELC